MPLRNLTSIALFAVAFFNAYQFVVSLIAGITITGRSNFEVIGTVCLGSGLIASSIGLALRRDDGGGHYLYSFPLFVAGAVEMGAFLLSRLSPAEVFFPPYRLALTFAILMCAGAVLGLRAEHPKH